MKRAKDGTHQAYVLLSLQESGSMATAHGRVLISPQAGSSPQPGPVFAAALPGRGSAVRNLEGVFLFLFFLK